MNLKATDFYTYFRPQPCETRVYLRSKGSEESDISPYARILIELGLQFEQQYFQSFSQNIDLSKNPREERQLLTKSAVERKEPIIYQPSLCSSLNLGDELVNISGDPDFLIYENSSYLIRDVKLARRITEQDHPEILRQLEIYGWLFEKTFGTPPLRLEVYTSKKEIVQIPYDGGSRALSELQRMYDLKRLKEQPYSPVGWSKCASCGFKQLCWDAAEQSRDIALIYGVDQSLAKALRKEGIKTYDQLLDQYDVKSLSDFKRPWGTRVQRVGKAAERILIMAKSLKTEKVIKLGPLKIKNSINYVMFDLEGLPPQMDELEKIYLWGTQVFGVNQGSFLSAVAESGESGDKIGWEKFLNNCEKIFGEFGEIPFIHWHHYEKVNVEKYIERFGDRLGIAARVIENMVDLLPLVRDSIALPLPSYSLKAIEKYVGFERTQSEYGGDLTCTL